MQVESDSPPPKHTVFCASLQGQSQGTATGQARQAMTKAQVPAAGSAFFRKVHVRHSSQGKA